MPAPAARLSLSFDPQNLHVGDQFDIRNGLSAVALDGDHLWLACDEGCRLERLSRESNADRFGGHRSFGLADFLELPADPQKDEADVEGLDVEDGYLWLIGSHSLKRKKPKEGKSKPSDVSARLADMKRDGNRHLLARIPLDGGALARAAGHRRAGGISTSPKSSALLDAIVAGPDPHLAAFVSIPGKDNGFDIEGLAVRGNRVFVGLRGPVLREWCCILELHVDDDDDAALTLRPLGGASYRKHFLKLNGLGVRDLAWLDDDLLVLAGPTMTHDGPGEVWRWTRPLESADAAVEATRVLMLPDVRGNDRAEGMTVVKGGPPSLLVVFDSPTPQRLVDDHSIVADVFRI